MSEPEIHGPIDLVVLEFPSGASGAAMADALVDLLDRGIVRLYDLMVVRKEADGSCTEVDLTAADDGALVSVQRLAGARSGLVGADDLPDLGSVLEPETTAVVLVYENAWAVPFVRAAFAEGGQMVATHRIPAQDLLDALDAVEAD
jgi:hypothetical protein